MRQRILGIIGVVWGAAVLLSGLLSSSHNSSSGAYHSAYHSGQVAGLVFGAILLIVGARAVVKSLR
jgi:hypothetical protein